MTRTTAVMCLLWVGILAASARGEEPIAVGKGSYADVPPPSAGKGAEEMLRRDFPIVGGPGKRPIPTNKHWTWLLNGKASGSLWLYPLRVDIKETGVELFLPLTWNANGSDPVCEAPLRVSGVDFAAKTLLVKDWGDWTLTFRLQESADRYLDVTVGEGMPTVWVESRGVPLLARGGTDTTFREGGEGSLMVTSAGRSYGVFTAPGVRLGREGTAVRVEPTAGRAVAAFSALKKPEDLALFARSAISIPRESRVDWTYAPKTGKVTTTWTVRTEPMAAGLNDPQTVVQGWLPHHWRDANHALDFNGPEYLTPRGPLKTLSGNRFELVYDFAGFLPFLPAPLASAGSATKHGFDTSRMSDLLERRARNPKYGDDSYWGAKDLLQFAQYLHMARQLGDSTGDRLRDEARKALADWLTYTPGESAHYFAEYRNWHALIGFKDSYDSARFNDQHFHYGYFTLAAALLAMDDPTFLRDYGPMIRLVAKQYANWDRQDSRFPFFRTFDLWAGHSWAGGLGSPGGNNQESTSEAMQSWIGLYLLGTMLGDAEMTSAGALGYAMESRATMEYWLNDHGDLFPRQYGHPIVGVLWSGGNVFGTYFSGDPAWVYAIQTLPQSPGLDYLARDPVQARALFYEILALRKAKEGSDDLATMGDLGNVMLSQAALVDPEWAVGQFDRLWEAKNPIARESLDAARTYYHAHAYRGLGRRLTDVRLSLPSGAVYAGATPGAPVYAVYNPRAYPVVVEAARGATILGEFVAPPLRLTTVSKLQPAGQSAGLAGSVPGEGDQAVDRRLDRVSLVFRNPVDPAGLTGIRLEGPGQPTLAFSTEDDGRVAVGRLSGPLKPGSAYRLNLPVSLKSRDGKPALSAAKAIGFTVETQPPMTLERSNPADGQSRVDPARPGIVLGFNAPVDPKTLGRIRLEGPEAPAISTRVLADGWQVGVDPAAPLRADESYAVIVSAGLASVFGPSLTADRVVRFTTAPMPCPPNVYRESFAGGGYNADSTLTVDLNNAEAPHSGRLAIKLTAADREGTVSFFHGSGDQGDSRSPVDLSRYRAIEFWIKGTAPDVWLKIGHPVFDKNAFNQMHLEGVTGAYRRCLLEIPTPKTEINTLLVISVPAGKSVYLDDIRFVGAPGERSAPTSKTSRPARPTR